MQNSKVPKFEAIVKAKRYVLFLRFTLAFCDPNFASVSKTKLQNRFLRCLIPSTILRAFTGGKNAKIYVAPSIYPQINITD